MTIELHSNLLNRHKRTSASDLRRCEWPDCKEVGACRAPKSPDELHEFRWFCKEHAREYNKSWNYYEGMNDEQIEADRRRDTVWRRPSWRLGGTNYLGAEYGGFDPGKLDDPLGIFEDAEHRHQPPKSDVMQNATAEQRNAFAVFSLDGPMTEDTVKQRYKELVKRYHPDAAGFKDNPDKTRSDDKIKEVNQAYRVLLKFLCE